MIVVIGHPLAALTGDGWRPAGSAALAALEAARAGAQVQVVGKTGDDPTGDAVVLALAAAGVGHVALLRDPSRPTPVLTGTSNENVDEDGADAGHRIEPADPDRRPTLEAADVELGLRYLSDFRAVVLAEPMPDAVVRVAADAARYAGAQLIVVSTEAGDRAGIPVEALVFEVTGGDPGATAGAKVDLGFAALVGQVAAAIDLGGSADDAIRAAVGRVGATKAR